MYAKKDLVFAGLCSVALLTMPIIAKAVDVVAPTAEQRAQETNSVTQDFVRQAVSGNMFEIESSRLAVKRTKNPEIKKFAAQMVSDHTKAATDMKLAISKAKIDPTIVPKVMEDSHLDKLEELKSASDANFDEDFVAAQEAAHDKAIDLYETYSKDGDNHAIKEFATKTLPVLKKHDAHVEKLDDQE